MHRLVSISVQNASELIILGDLQTVNNINTTDLVQIKIRSPGNNYTRSPRKLDIFYQINENT